MKKLYLLTCAIFLIFNAASALNRYQILPEKILQAGDTVKSKSSGKSAAKTDDANTEKSSFFKNGIKVLFSPFKPLIGKSGTTTTPSSKNSSSKNTAIVKPDSAQPGDDKTLSNVKVYPNPVDDEINLSYRVNKDSNVTIKIMDVLGNEIATLMSQKLTAGEQLNTFNISSRLSSGFYFIRLVVGNEVVVKRISVL